MLSGETILCYAADPWVGSWRNRHQIMTRLARDNTVLYVEPRIYLGETVRRLRDGRLRLADLRRPLAERYRDGLWIYHDPYYAPFAGRLSGGPLTARLRQAAARRTLRRLGTAAPILWLLRPYQMDQIGRYGEKLVVYHVTDEYSAFPQERDPEAFHRAELRTSAPGRSGHRDLAGAVGKQAAAQPAHLPGAQCRGLCRFSGGPGFRPGAEVSGTGLLEDRPHPRIGYVGALNEKLDLALLRAVAQARPDWQFLLIGFRTFYAEPEKLDLVRGLPNVLLPGSVAVEDVPLAIAACDVCILPYERNTWTGNIDSLKLYEYLACGRPVVSTDIPAARVFGELVRIAGEPAGFIAAIEAALAEDTPELPRGAGPRPQPTPGICAWRRFPSCWSRR